MSVTLEKYMADDLDIVNAAKVSFHKHSQQLGMAETAIIDSMLRNGHGSPFEHCVFKFRVRTPIGVAREWFRHRIGSFNEESTRYVEMRDDFYVPEGDAIRKMTDGTKPMQYSYEPITDPELAAAITDVFERTYDVAYTAYQMMIAKGVAKELARNVLPLGLLTEFVWTVNLRSLFNFLMLRHALPALREIREEAAEVEQLVTEVMPVTMGLWNKHGRPKV